MGLTYHMSPLNLGLDVREEVRDAQHGKDRYTQEILKMDRAVWQEPESCF